MKKKMYFAAVCALGFAILSSCGMKEDGYDEKKNVNKNVNKAPATENVSELTGDKVTDSVNKDEEAVSPELKKIRDMISDSGKMVGIAFLGASDAETSEEVKKAIGNSAGVMQYTFLSECEPVLTQGSQVYAFVPVDDECVITIYNSNMNQDCEYIDDRENPLYQGKKGETVILRCNFSDLYSNVLVTVKNNDMEMEFRPSLSLRDGAVLLEEGCIDISVYADSIYDRRAEAEELLCSKDEIIDGLGRGMKLLCNDEEEIIDGESCIVFYLGTDHEENFVKEGTYAVSQIQVYWYDPIGDAWNILGEG